MKRIAILESFLSKADLIMNIQKEADEKYKICGFRNGWALVVSRTVCCAVKLSEYGILENEWSEFDNKVIDLAIIDELKRRTKNDPVFLENSRFVFYKNGRTEPIKSVNLIEESIESKNILDTAFSFLFKKYVSDSKAFMISPSYLVAIEKFHDANMCGKGFKAENRIVCNGILEPMIIESESGDFLGLIMKMSSEFSSKK